MSAIVVCYEHQEELNDINNALNKSKELNLYLYNAKTSDLQSIEEKITANEAYFLICSKTFSEEIVNNLGKLYSRHPLLTIIYFYAVLKEKDYIELNRAGIKYCFVGKTRRYNLKVALKKLLKHYWKRIPENLYETDYEDLTHRAKKILKYIEETPIRYCNTENISKHLNISQSHFRKEFKKYFGVNFRQFKQDLINHYENILLFDKKLKPGDVYNILDYKNLSAYSRSFKSRHGHSWQEIIKSYN